MATGGESLLPVALLLDEMKSEDVEARINAMRKLRVVAAALGPERTRKELIPFLSEQVEDDDEVLLVIADELGKMVELAGGPSNASVLIGPLGALASVEETVVRDKAVESACTVISTLSSADVVATVVPVLQRLSTGDWFTSRVSACGLFATTYGRLNATDVEQKKTLRTLYTSLCGDETPMVRRAASKNIGALAAAVADKDAVVAELLPLFHSLAGDDQDSVRLLAIENCTAFAKIFSQQENNTHVLPLVKACAGDKSWRVRNNVAREFYPLSEAMGVAVTRAELLPFFVRLLQDPEAEVRASAARNVSGYATLVGIERFTADILPSIRESVNDPAQNYRAALAESLVHVTASLPQDVALTTVVPLLLQALRDEAPEVRLKVLEGLGKVASTLGATYLESTVLPALVTLGGDALWRVREKVIAQIPLLANSLGAETFEKQLFPLYLGTYGDQVNAVRMAATRCLEPLTRNLGNSWVKSRLVPKLLELYRVEGSSYLQRITVLYGIRDLSVHADLRDVAEEFLPLLLTEALKDPVPNVRFVASHVLQDAVAAKAYSAAKITTDVLPALTALSASDSDTDVRYFAHVAAESI